MREVTHGLRMADPKAGRCARDHRPMFIELSVVGEDPIGRAGKFGKGGHRSKVRVGGHSPGSLLVSPHVRHFEWNIAKHD